MVESYNKWGEIMGKGEVEGYNKWGEMMGKGEVDGLRTVECLRGRLLAERVASKAAKVEAELMSKRLTELERLLAIEIKAQNRSEKKLKCVLKKLESRKSFDHSSQSDVSNVSGSSSSLQMQEERHHDSQAVESRHCCAKEKAGEMQVLSTSGELGDEISVDSADRSVSQEESWGSVETAHSDNKVDPCVQGTVEVKDSLHSDESRTTDTSTTRESSICGKEIDGAEHQTEYVDDTLALVPVSMWPNTDAASEIPSSSTVQSVLVALRVAKEQLQNSIRGRAVVCFPGELYRL